jgi:uncharacterized hydrophobic protein (TIGR00271 family)
MSTLGAQDQFRETVRQDIRNGAVCDVPYISMNVLAAVIACYGLLANSPAVVIGAMIVAMLLGPILGTALALVDSDMALLRSALFTLLGGAIVVTFTASVLGLVHRDIPITTEIMARTSPNLLDLMVALAGGAAGAYATVSPRLSVAFVGVAIATALVPPLSSASMLFVRGDYHLAWGAFLLAFTNMVAIQFASSSVLWLTGFRRVTRTEGMQLSAFVRRNAVSMAILILLGLSLTRNLKSVLAEQLFETSVRGALRQAVNVSAGSHLVEVRFEAAPDTTIVRAVMRGPNPPSVAQVADMEAKLPSPPDGSKIDLRIRFVHTTTLTRNGPLHADAEFGTDE